MELVSVMRVLARRRLLLAIGVLAAAAVGGAIASGVLATPERRTTLAYSQIQIDTPTSLLVDLEASSGTIGTQSAILASQMANGDVRGAIARTAGIAPRQLTVLTADAAQPPTVSPLATRAAEVATTPSGTYVLTVSSSTELPIIAVEASGPDSGAVGRLAQASRSVLQSVTEAGALSPRHRLSVKLLTPVVFADGAVSGGRNVLFGLIAFVALSAMWCGALVIASGVARAWRGESGGSPAQAGSVARLVGPP